MAHLIPEDAVSKYTAAPSQTRVDSAGSLHNNIRDTLGSGYVTFLQGSYKNDTGIADINDVDIVAIRKKTVSSQFTDVVSINSISWDTIFQEIQNILESSHHYRGKTERGDKCIKIYTGFRADVVPAVHITSDDEDPIAVYSFREQSERKNFPRIHYQNNVDKNARTNGFYKPVVRMFKYWARKWFEGTKIAPSFHIECAVYNAPDQRFISDLASAFFDVGSYLAIINENNSTLKSVAGDKFIVTESEWGLDNFRRFQVRLIASLLQINKALEARSAAEAKRLWREAFNE